MRFPFKTLIWLLILLIFSLSTLAASKSDPNVALVYNGKYADADGAQSVADLAEEFDLEVKYFSAPSQIVSKLATTRVIIIGGTVDDINPFIEAFTPDIIKAIKAYLNKGGRYLGICGGAYMASTGWEEEDGFIDALGLMRVETDSFSTDPDPKVITVAWKDKKRTIYYQYGPYFILPASAGVKVVAKYQDGKVAACYQKVGNGKVYVCGPHPEADETWIEDDVENGAAWKPTDDLAEDMMEEVLKD
jgi:glutamine amidotransferase-like uncharacterized protein